MGRTRARLLVVEEEREAIPLASSLSTVGFDVTVVSGRAAAKEAIARFRFDVAFSGMHRDGDTSLLAALKAADPQMEVVAAATTPAHVSALVRSGAFACVAKPYDLSEVRALMGAAVHASGRLFGCVTLYEASRTLLATLKQADLVPLIVTLADRVMPSDGIGLLLTGAAAPAGFECHASHRARDLARPALMQLAMAARNAGRAVVLPSEATPPSAVLPAGCKEAGIGSLVSYPLAEGALVFLRASGRPAFSEAELERGVGFAAQVSLALENAQTYREVEDKMRKLRRTQGEPQLRQRLTSAGALDGALADQIDNPLAALACNLEALQSYSSDVESLWGAAKAAAEFLVEQAEPTGQRLSRRVLGDAAKVERTDRMVTEVACAIDECLSGVRRIADLIRTLHDAERPLEPTGAVEDVALGALLASCRETRGTRGGRALELVVSSPASVTLPREAVETAVHRLLDALDQVPRVHVAITLTLEAHGELLRLSFTDPELKLSLADVARLAEARAPKSQGALECALAAAVQAFERTGATVAVEALEPRGTAFSFTYPARFSE
jgi:hypothetical protein